MLTGNRPLHLCFFSLLLVSVAISSAPPGVNATLRSAVWAGIFYPAKSEALRTQIAHLCNQARQTSPPLAEHGALRALILPHAGYPFSGQTAAHAARVLAPNKFTKVILIGPDHQVGFRGGAISTATGYSTPLGTIPLHGDAQKLLKQTDLFHSSTISDQREHSIEVILPFLQYLLGDFSLVPIVLGPGKTEDIAEALRPLINDQTLLVISSDLSHYLPYKEAEVKDQHTIAGILKLDATVLAENNSACGKYGLQLLLYLAKKLAWQPVLLHYANSGDTAGSKERVVGYSAMAFFAHKAGTLALAQGQVLVHLARQTLETSLGQETTKEQQLNMTKALQDKLFSHKMATFVTLSSHGQLRGCMGSISPHLALAEDVRHNAINAAFNDPRFPPLQRQELADIVIEVSILTPPKPLVYTDGADLLQKIRPQRDGVILRYGWHSSTYLPQVWQQLPDPTQFLRRLCRKAGLAPDAWQKQKLEVQTYQVQHFKE